MAQIIFFQHNPIFAYFVQLKNILLIFKISFFNLKKCLFRKHGKFVSVTHSKKVTKLYKKNM
jgi:hypothetical protein